MILTAFANKQPHLAYSEVLPWEWIGCERENGGNGICERNISIY